MADELDGEGVASEAASADARRSAFMRDLVHDLSTPLTPISGYLTLLRGERMGPLTEQQRKAVQAMTSAVARLSRIVENLSDLASLQAGPSAIRAGPLDPDALAEAAAEDLRAAAQDLRLHLEVRTAGGGEMVGDARKLRQAITSVLQNAVKFSPHGGEVLLEVSRDAEHVRFSIYDQGPGISAAEAAELLEPFQRSARPEERRRPGSGLGLPVAGRIAAAHGGSLTVESPPHTQPASGWRDFNGSKFVLELPLRPPPEVARPSPTPAPARASG
ncbi:MAG TPA: HAMP domain-containing sensor histidine kinase [Anaeromyxobacteraceae bacterium]|nr:HAMP domain-containing sensor histidine kinase [Anaeromyxobacteraceae bacterium]